MKSTKMAVLTMFASLDFGACTTVKPGEVGVEVEFGLLQSENYARAPLPGVGQALLRLQSPQSMVR